MPDLSATAPPADSDFLRLAPFALATPLPTFEEAEDLMAQARRLIADRDLALATAAREHAENLDLRYRMAALVRLCWWLSAATSARRRATATTVEFPKVPWPLKPAADPVEPDVEPAPAASPKSEAGAARHRGHGRFRSRAQRNQPMPASCVCGCPNDTTTS